MYCAKELVWFCCIIAHLEIGDLRSAGLEPWLALFERVAEYV